MDSLLKSKRQELHAKIARAIEESASRISRPPSPKCLLHHYTRAGPPSRVPRIGLEAGQKALSRMALTEAVAHLEAGPWRDWEPAGLGSARQIGNWSAGHCWAQLPGSLSRLVGAAARGGAQAFRAAAGQSRPTAEASGTHAVGAVGANDVRGPRVAESPWSGAGRELLSAGKT